ncbi:MAG: hypothetical protein H6677_05355 [Candidatus Obscuribacterales bacterium]|nr:hypothetical protein [Candidatus Obscuribacterales bacterium]
MFRQPDVVGNFQLTIKLLGLGSNSVMHESSNAGNERLERILPSGVKESFPVFYFCEFVHRREAGVLPVPYMYDIQTVAQLANALDSSEFELLRFIYRAEEFYTRFRKKKSTGDMRTVAAPRKPLKAVQKAIVKKFLADIPLPDECTGFRPGMSILSNAQPHCKKRFVFNTDLEDFFGSISSERVLGLYLRLGFSFPVACVLTELTTYIGCLPQGAPSSPYLANLIAYSMDADLADFCAANEWSYTRYCDDITISGNGNFSLADMRTISDIVEVEGFRMNIKKTRFHKHNSKQMVSGLVVNEKPSLPRAKRRKIRAIFHQAEVEPERYGNRVKELENHLSILSMLDPQSKEVEKYRTVLNRLISQAK